MFICRYSCSALLEGQDLEAALRDTIKEYQNHEECSERLTLALELALSASDNDISRLGEGIGEEVLAISVYCALKHRDDFKKALIAAVNHDGDSDSRGAITGNVLGVYLGIQMIPEDWDNGVEMREVLTQIADDLHAANRGKDDWQRDTGISRDFKVVEKL